MITDDSIREVHGCACRLSSNKSGHVELHEGEQSIVLIGSYENKALTAYQARYLASKLYRLSRRIRVRAEAALRTADKGGDT